MDEIRTNEFGDILKVERRALWWGVLGGNISLVYGGQWLLVHSASRFDMPSPEFLRAIAIVLYLGCWILGSNFDANAQRQVYWNTKNSSNEIGSIYLIVVALIMAGIVLLWANHDEKYFALSLSIFLVINVISWRVFVRIARPTIQSSEITYSRFLPYKLDALTAVTAYVTGRWQWYRFAAMLVVTLSLDAVCFLPNLAGHLISGVTIISGARQVDIVEHFLPTFLTVTFMLVGEVWGWLMRLRVYLALRRSRNQLAIDGVVSESSMPEDGSNLRDDEKLQNERIVQFFKSQLLVPKLLLSAHGAGLMLCVKYLLDHSASDTARFGGISFFTCVFAAGLVLAAFGWAALMISQNTVLDALWFKVAARTNSVKAAVKGWLDIVASSILLGVGIVAFVVRIVQ
jgi:hypothetical protein